MTRPTLHQMGWLAGPAALLLVAVALTGADAPIKSSKNVEADVAVTAEALRVIDGDTVEFEGLNYRLVGYDTPEVFHAECDAEKALGNRATARLRGMIDTARFIELRVESGRDRYGRGLGRLLIDHRDAGDVLISEGLARSYDGGRRIGWC